MRAVSREQKAVIRIAVRVQDVGRLTTGDAVDDVAAGIVVEHLLMFAADAKRGTVGKNLEFPPDGHASADDAVVDVGVGSLVHTASVRADASVAGMHGRLHLVVDVVDAGLQFCRLLAQFGKGVGADLLGRQLDEFGEGQ